jgi:hypothetical protein
VQGPHYIIGPGGQDRAGLDRLHNDDTTVKVLELMGEYGQREALAGAAGEGDNADQRSGLSNDSGLGVTFNPALLRSCGPPRAGYFGLRAHVDVPDAPKTVTRTQRGEVDLRALDGSAQPSVCGTQWPIKRRCGRSRMAKLVSPRTVAP